MDVIFIHQKLPGVKFYSKSDDFVATDINVKAVDIYWSTHALCMRKEEI